MQDLRLGVVLSFFGLIPLVQARSIAMVLAGQQKFCDAGAAGGKGAVSFVDCKATFSSWHFRMIVCCCWAGCGRMACGGMGRTDFVMALTRDCADFVSEQMLVRLTVSPYGVTSYFGSCI